MSLDNNETFYRKLLWRIVVCLCVVFLFALNIKHYQVLLTHGQVQKEVVEAQSVYTFSIFLTPLKENNNPKMIFLSYEKNQTYSSAIFSLLGEATQKNIMLINCAEKEPVELEKKLRAYKVVKESCEIQEEKLKSMLLNDDNVVVFNMGQNFSHQAALRVGRYFKLIPHLKIAEIKNANQRL